MPWVLRILELCGVIILGVIIYLSGIYSWLSESSLDALFRIRGSRIPSQEIVIVGIDEESLEKISSWPFSHEVHAQLVRNLHQAKSIGFDLLFTNEASDDYLLAKAFANSPPVFLAISRDFRGELILPPPILRNVTSVGHIETELGDGGVIRRVKMFMMGFPVLASAMAPELIPWQKETAIINFYGPEFTFLYVSYYDALSGEVSEDFFKDRYVLVGAKAQAMGDTHVTPFSSKFPVPGVEVQATILSNLLEKDLIDDAELFSIALTYFFLFLSWSLWSLLRESLKLAVSVSATLVICLVSYIAFRNNVFLNPVGPILAVALSYFVHLSILWSWVGARLVREIKILDQQLAQGLELVFETLPVGWQTFLGESNNLPPARGIHRHIRQMHEGIHAMTLQNNFINHLLSEETPPLALWQKYDGQLVLANARFRDSWQEIFGEDLSLPDLDEFGGFVANNILKTKDAEKIEFSRAWLSSKARDSVIDICSSTIKGNLFHRLLIHHVQSSVLGFAGVLVSFTNVTEIRNLERLKGDILNVVSHELRLPLTTIMGFSEMLVDSLNGRERKYADEILRQSKRFSRMIDDFLDIARMESGRYQMKIFAYDLLAIVYDAVSSITLRAQKKDISIDLRLPAKISPMFGDEALLTQAVLNLLDNAVKFSPLQSTVILTVTEMEHDIRVDITDQGPGISREDQQTIFEQFSRGNRQVKGDGFGLGLSFVQSVISGHKGTIEVESGFNKAGSTFSFTLPKRNIAMDE